MNYPYVDIHTHSYDEQPGVIKLKSYLIGSGKPLPEGYYSAGVHPWSVNGANENLMSEFPVGDANFVAVGEIGLDFAAKNFDKAKQMWWFNRQIELAERLNKPIVIHCIRAHNELLYEVEKHIVETMIIHSYIGSCELTKQLLDAGFYLSFGVNSLRSHKTIDALKSIPMDRIFIESDDTGVDIKKIYTDISEILNVEIDTLKDKIYKSYIKCKIG